VGPTAHWHHTPPAANPANEHVWDEGTRTARWPTGECIVDIDPMVKATPGWKRRPAIFTPRWAGLPLLRVEKIRVEPVTAISVTNALAEGMQPHAGDGCDMADEAMDLFRERWDAINGKRNAGAYAWEKSPWVWAVTFSLLPTPSLPTTPV